MSATVTLLSEPVELKPTQGQKLSQVFLILTGVGAGLSLLGLALGEELRKQFFFSYLTAYIFVIQICLGSLFWVLLHHLVDAGWSVVVRRVAENLAYPLLFAGALFLPILAGMGTLYSWTHEPHSEPLRKLLRGKEPYLTVGFFVARAVIYFAIWGWLTWRFVSWSREQDRTRDVALTLKMQRLAPVAVIVLALTSAFAGIDWIMTLDFTWFSTMFGVYFWAGALLSSIAAISLIVVRMRREGVLGQTITPEHLHDLGKLTFAFVTFWAYITFSQYFLVWYADIPEEITWFSNRRWVGHGAGDRHLGSWHWVGVAIVFGHVILPFLVLLSRHCKRNPRLLGATVTWILVIHFVEIHWQILPTLHREGIRPCWLDLATLAALVGGTGFVVLREFKRGAVLPVGDPRLQESLTFQNF